MPKALCLTGIVIAIFVLVVFLPDLFGPESIAPLKKASRLMDIVYVLCAVALGYLSWVTFKEQD